MDMVRDMMENVDDQAHLDKVEVLIHVNRVENPCKSVSENLDALKALIKQVNQMQKECNCHCTLSVNV